MKNSINILISCIITAIVVSSVSIYATIMMKASEIEFNPEDPSWNVNNVNDAINSLNNISNMTVQSGVMNGSTGILSFKITKDNENALIISGQSDLVYSINSTNNWKGVTLLGNHSYDVGYYYANISVKKDDVIYLKQSTSGLFAYSLIY